MKSIGVLLCLSITIFSARAATIGGTVTEQRTGYALSRATVTLEPIGNARQVRSTRTGEKGQFLFSGLSAGSYLLKASRRGFIPVQYGQRRWDAAGVPIVVTDDVAITVTVPMLRYGAIVGTVRDENEVGIPDQNVAAYADRQPPVLVTRGTSDERGVFRIAGLEPGNYLVRTTGNNDEDRSYLPTFSQQTLRVEESRTVVVYADQDTTDADVRPITGKLFELSGYLPLPRPFSFSVTVTLASDLGRVTSNGSTFRFTALAPGHYELYAEAKEDPPGARVLGGHMDVLIERNIANLALPMNEVRGTRFELDGAGPDTATTALVRRKDYTGVGPVRTVTLNTVTSVVLSPGRWEVKIIPARGYYVSKFEGTRESAVRPDGWNEILAGSFGSVHVTLSSGPAAIHGTVRNSTTPSAGAPVFLEAWDPVTRTRISDLRETRSDMNGKYQFDSLAPGDYRILSTFDYATPNSDIFAISGARSVHLERTNNSELDLDLWGSF